MKLNPNIEALINMKFDYYKRLNNPVNHLAGSLGALSIYDNSVFTQIRLTDTYIDKLTNFKPFKKVL